MAVHPIDIQTKAPEYHWLKRNQPEKDKYGQNNFSQRDREHSPHRNDSFVREVGTAVHLTNPRVDDSKCTGSIHLRSHSPHIANVRIVYGDHLSTDQHRGYPANKTSMVDKPNRIRMANSSQESMGGENCKAGYQRNSYGTSASQMNIRQQREIWPRGSAQSGTLVCDAGTQTYLTMAHLRPKLAPSSVPRIMCRSQRKTDDPWSSQHGSHQAWQPLQSPSLSVPYGSGFQATVPSRVLREVGTQSDTCGLSYSCQPPAREISKMGGVVGVGHHRSVPGLVTLLFVLGTLYLHQKRHQRIA